MTLEWTDLEDIFLKPENRQARIWRYMDFTKFVSLLDKQSLFFPSAELLRKSSDRFEGSFSKANLAIRETISDISKENRERMYKEFGNLFKGLIGKITLISAWHMNEYESAAMWSTYLSTLEGIAIQSTFENLSNCLKPPNGTTLRIGKVNYVDFNTTPIPEWNTMAPFMYKRKSFEYENEIRALISFNPHLFNETPLSEEAQQILNHNGYYVPADISGLIKNIYVAPYAPDWFAELVESIVKKYDFNIPVHQSDLSSDPVY